MKKSLLAKIIFIIMIILLIIGVILLPFIPRLYNMIVSDAILKFGSHSIIYQLTFYLCYLLCLKIIFILICIFKSIYDNGPFTKKIEKYLKIIAILFMLLFVITGIKAFFIPTILTLAIVLISFVVSLCFYSLAEIIKTAIIYKMEVDLTV